MSHHIFRAHHLDTGLCRDCGLLSGAACHATGPVVDAEFTAADALLAATHDRLKLALPIVHALAMHGITTEVCTNKHGDTAPTTDFRSTAYANGLTIVSIVVFYFCDAGGFRDNDTIWSRSAQHTEAASIDALFAALAAWLETDFDAAWDRALRSMEATP